jgi:uncharacterized protein (UPF0248 family)
MSKFVVTYTHRKTPGAVEYAFSDENQIKLTRDGALIHVARQSQILIPWHRIVEIDETLSRTAIQEGTV